MHAVNEDAIALILCACGCLFWGNLYRIEQQGAYGEIKGLSECDDD